MAAKAINPDTAAQVVADWRTGEYSQRDLTAKHRVSVGVVARLTKGVHKDMSAIVSAGIQYRSGLAAHDERTAHAITDVVNQKVARMEYLSDAAIRNVEASMSADCADQQDYRHRATTIKAALEVVDPQRGTGVAVQINNSQQQVVAGAARELIESRLAALAARRGGGPTI